MTTLARGNPLTVADWMTPAPVVVPADLPLSRCAEILRQKGFRHLPVVDPLGRAVGLLSDFDVTSRGETLTGMPWTPFDEASARLTALDVAAPITVRLDRAAPLADGIVSILDARAEVAVVVDEDDKPVGVLAEHDVALRAPSVLRGDCPLPRRDPSRLIAVQQSEGAIAAWKLMQAREVRHVVVLDGATVYGVLSARDLVADDVPAGRDLSARDAVRDLCPIVALEGTGLVEAARTLAACRIGCLPVVTEDGTVRGVVTRTDVLRAVLDAVNADAVT